MDYGILPLIITITVALVIVVVVTLVRGVSVSRVQRFGRSVGLQVPAGLETSIRSRLARRALFGSIGALVATVVILGVILLGVLPYDRQSTIWLVLGGLFAGAGAGSALAALTERATAAPDSARFARSGAVDLGDYLAPVELVGVRVVVGASVAVLLGSIVVGVTRVEAWSATLVVASVVVALAVASLVVFEVAGRRIIDRGRPAGSPAELAWDDAMRATSLRELLTAPLCLGLWGTLIIVFEVLEAFSVGPESSMIGAVVGLLLVVGAIVFAIVATASKPQQHYLRRLWPEVAAR
jgi:hypothetical protein